MSSQRILVIDDDTELCGLLKEYFESEGFGVRLAHDGAEALKQLRRYWLLKQWQRCARRRERSTRPQDKTGRE